MPDWPFCLCLFSLKVKDVLWTKYNFLWQCWRKEKSIRRLFYHLKTRPCERVPLLVVGNSRQEVAQRYLEANSKREGNARFSCLGHSNSKGKYIYNFSWKAQLISHFQWPCIQQLLYLWPRYQVYKMCWYPRGWGHLTPVFDQQNRFMSGFENVSVASVSKGNILSTKSTYWSLIPQTYPSKNCPLG